MTDLKPNDLVVKLAGDLGTAGELTLPARASRERKVDQLASSQTPELLTFIGYLGASTTGQDGGTWWRLYLNWRLSECLLVREEDIVANDRIKDPDAEFDVRDVLWVKADAMVKTVSGSVPADVQFLTGEFTRAGDFEVGIDGGTATGATGVFCEARSVGCCKPRTTKRPR